MSARDRIVLVAIAVAAVLGAGWMLAVKPAQEKASKAAGEVSAARAQLTTVQGEIATASSARQRYRAAYASLATLGIAVPTTTEVPTLMYAIDQASGRKHVEFTSISNGSSSGSSGSSGSTPAAAAATGFKQMPLTFVFNGTYRDLISFLKQLEGFTTQGPSNTLQVSGRLLTIQGITFASGATGASPQSGGSSASGGKAGEMSWTINATAYALPPTPVTPAAPGAAGSGASQPASSASSASPAGTPAVVRATP
jgi:Tfp pilus assembly protein PilO